MAQELLIKMDSVKSSGMDWFYRMEALAAFLYMVFQILIRSLGSSFSPFSLSPVLSILSLLY